MPRGTPQKVQTPEKIDYKREFVMLFSNRKSLFSSKKIERLLVFSTFLTISLIYLAKNINTIGATDFIQVIGIWLVYGGYSSAMSLKDKKMDNEITNQPYPEPPDSD